MKKKKSRILYGIIVLLILFFVLVLLLSANVKRVTPVYEDYYLKHELDHYIEDKTLKKYTADQIQVLSSATSPENLGGGWSGFEGASTWMVGNRSVFYLYLTRPEQDYLLLLDPEQDLDYTRTLEVNGVNIGVLEKQPDGILTKQIPSSILRKGVNRFAVCTDEEVLPFNLTHADSLDGRELNLYVHTIELRSLG